MRINVGLLVAGSPPQVRGKLLALIGVEDTPQDHPRRCGENRATPTKRRNLLGSPPQVRGKLTDSKGRMGFHRITPAGAGKTAERRGAVCGISDHPRRCGENEVSQFSIYDVRGSPPQVRGKHGFGDVWVRIPRITPAGAGKTLRAASTALIALGSPPQVRGKLMDSILSFSMPRITPAGAGKTI